MNQLEIILLDKYDNQIGCLKIVSIETEKSNILGWDLIKIFVKKDGE